MTMNVVLGDGELPGKELDALLADLWEKAIKADDPFWFLVQGKAEPTTTDQRMVQWLIANDIYYEMVSDGSEADIYEAYQNKYTVKRLAPKVVTLMQETPDEGEEARLLALFASDDPDAEEDRWLNDAIQAVADANFTVLAMNDGMQEIRVVATEEGDELDGAAVQEEAPMADVVPMKKAAAKKAAAKPVDQDEEAAPAAPGSYTREQLEELDLDGLKEAAANLGISLPPRTRMPTYIEAILGNNKDTEVEVTDVDVETPEPPPQPFINTTPNTSGTVNTTNTFTALSVSAPAMLIVVYNGTVVSRAVTEEEARTLIAAH